GALPVPAISLQVFEAGLNGLVTNDKFCLSRSARLSLSHWHLPWCRRRGTVAQGVYPAHQRIGVGGYTDEAAAVANPPPVCAKSRRPASVGSGVSAPRPVEP